MVAKIIVCILITSLLFPLGPLAAGTVDPQAGTNPGIVENVTEAILREYIQALQDFGPRPTGSPAIHDAASYIASQFQDFGLTVRQHAWYDIYSEQGDINIEGTLPGVNQSSTDVYIICAHHDTVSDSPGADDNGSGTAAVLAAARVLSQYTFEHTIRFVTFSGEEQGLLGSHEYAREANETGDNIIAVLNADMIAYTETAEGQANVIVHENQASTWITEAVIDVAQGYPQEINLNITRSGPSSGSDHFYFWEYGFDSLFFSEYEFNDPNYHSPSDTIDKLDLDYATRVTRLMVGTLIELADIKEGDFEKPWLSLEKPQEGYLYLENRELFPLPLQSEMTVILGGIDIQATAGDTGSGIQSVEFYIDDELKMIDTDAPYTYTWDERTFFSHILRVSALDNAGNLESKELKLFVINL